MSHISKARMFNELSKIPELSSQLLFFSSLSPPIGFPAVPSLSTHRYSPLYIPLFSLAENELRSARVPLGFGIVGQKDWHLP
jgi:hypothetical protein